MAAMSAWSSRASPPPVEPGDQGGPDAVATGQIGKPRLRLGRGALSQRLQPHRHGNARRQGKDHRPERRIADRQGQIRQVMAGRHRGAAGAGQQDPQQAQPFGGFEQPALCQRPAQMRGIGNSRIEQVQRHILADLVV
jgi:hypothetical protein